MRALRVADFLEVFVADLLFAGFFVGAFGFRFDAIGCIGGFFAFFFEAFFGGFGYGVGASLAFGFAGAAVFKEEGFGAVVEREGVVVVFVGDFKVALEF